MVMQTTKPSTSSLSARSVSEESNSLNLAPLRDNRMADVPRASEKVTVSGLGSGPISFTNPNTCAAKSPLLMNISSGLNPTFHLLNTLMACSSETTSMYLIQLELFESKCCCLSLDTNQKGPKSGPLLSYLRSSL